MFTIVATGVCVMKMVKIYDLMPINLEKKREGVKEKWNNQQKISCVIFRVIEDLIFNKNVFEVHSNK